MVKIFLTGLVAIFGIGFILMALYMFWVVIIEDVGDNDDLHGIR